MNDHKGIGTERTSPCRLVQSRLPAVVPLVRHASSLLPLVQISLLSTPSSPPPDRPSSAIPTLLGCSRIKKPKSSKTRHRGGNAHRKEPPHYRCLALSTRFQERCVATPVSRFDTHTHIGDQHLQDAGGSHKRVSGEPISTQEEGGGKRPRARQRSREEGCKHQQS